MTQLPNLLVDVDEAMRYLGVSRTTIYRYFENGTLTRVKVGEGQAGAVRVRTEELYALAGSTVESGESTDAPATPEEDPR